jgi:hypothetical protein
MKHRSEPTKELSWTPVLRGPIFCSPACGAGCSKAGYDLACKQSAALAKHLGKGWHARVAENLHWYWSVDNGGLSLWPSSAGSYMVILNTRGFSFVKHGKNPRAIIKAAIEALDAHIALITKQRKELA